MSVEFLPGQEPVDAPDESLVTPERSRRRGGWWVLGALLAIGATLWALSRPTLSPSHEHLGAPVPAASPRTDPQCRAIPNCAVRDAVPRSIARLARSYLPPGVRLRVRTVFVADSLRRHDEFVGRDIDAHVDSVSVLIRVRRGGSGTHVIAPDPLGVGSLLLHEVNSGFVVRLQYLAPDTVPPMLERLRALIRDPRLTST